MNGSSRSVIESRSMPDAIPPCGGAPIASASSRKPNFVALVLRRDARAGRRPSPAASGSWIRNEPPRELDAVADEVVRDARSPRPGRCRAARRPSSVGRVNGWWTASQRPVSSSHSNIGKSVTHRNATPRRRSARARGRGAAAARRARASDLAGSSAAKSTRRRRLAARSARARPRERNFAIGERTSPVLVVDEVREPLRAPLLRDAPRASSSSPRESSRGTRRNRTAVRAARTPRTPSRASTSVASSISSPKRRSGLSEP